MWTEQYWLLHHRLVGGEGEEEGSGRERERAR